MNEDRRYFFFRCGAAVLSGFLITLSMPVKEFFFIGWFALTPLILVSLRQSKKAAFFLGIVSGLAFHITSLYWIPHVIHNFSNLPLAGNIPLFLLLVLYLSLFFGVFSLLVALFNRSFGKNWVWAAPVAWTALEYLKGNLLTGFPWCLLGYSQYRHPCLIQVSTFTGVYGVSFILVFSSSILAMAWIARKRIKSVLSLTALAILLIVLNMTIGCMMIPESGNLSKDTFLVACIQDNFSQEMRWESASEQEIEGVYRRLSLEAASQGADLIIWPEATFPTYYGYNRDAGLRETINRICSLCGVDILFGNTDVTGEGETLKVYNCTFLISPGGGAVQKYDKRHLVPWGEYTPLKSVFFFLDRIVEGISDFSPGEEEQDLLSTGSALRKDGRDVPFGVGICYEIIFPDLIRQMVDRGAQFVATLTNDAWFGPTSAPYQHFAMAVFRSVENRRYLVRCATTGISGIVDPFGRIVRRSMLNERTVIMGPIRACEEKTFYTRHGDLFSYLMIFISLLLLILVYFNRKHDARREGS